MPGVFRPYNLVDVLGTMNEQLTAPVGDTINGFGFFAETDEQATMNDSVTATAMTNVNWDQGTWGTVSWG